MDKTTDNVEASDTTGSSMQELAQESIEETSATEAETDNGSPEQPEPEKTPEKAEEVEESEEQGQSEDDDSFFDPTKVPDELKPAYKQMQAAFTKKTQEISEIRKQAEEASAKAAEYSKYEQYAPIIEEMLSPRNQSNALSNVQLTALEKELKDAGYNDDAIDLMKRTTGYLTNLINQDKQAEMQSRQQAEQEQQVLSGIEKAKTVDPRLTDESLVYETADGEKKTFGDYVEEMVMATPGWQKDVPGATKRAIARLDALIGKAKSEGKQELSNSAGAKARRFPSQSSSPQGSESANSQPTSIAEAAKQARSELGL